MDNGSSSVVRENDDDDTNGNVVTMTMMVSEDQLPYVILHGNDANLSALRPTASNTNNSNSNSEGEGGGEEKEATTLSTSATSTTYFNQRSEPPIMSSPIHCRLKCNFDSPSSLLSSQKSESDVAEAKHNENEEKEEIVAETESEGLVFISSNQVCFVETTSTTTATRNSDATQQEPRDIAIGATCITLHAMTEEPELAIYLQLSSSDSDDNNNNNNINQEVTIVPFDPNSCQILFDKLCKLVSNHPLDVDDDNNEDDGGYGGGYDDVVGGGGGLMSFMGGLGEGGNTGDDDVIWAPSGGFVDPEQQHKRDGDLVGGQAEEATDEERDAMLERLDNLLIINPEYETQDGQFDDAAEDEN